MLDAILHKRLRQISIMHPLPITTYGQFYEACGAFPDDQWNSVLAAFTMFVTESPTPAEV